jgi:hypothetical protein
MLNPLGENNCWFQFQVMLGYVQHYIFRYDARHLEAATFLQLLPTLKI